MAFTQHVDLTCSSLVISSALRNRKGTWILYLFGDEGTKCVFPDLVVGDRVHFESRMVRHCDIWSKRRMFGLYLVGVEY